MIVEKTNDINYLKSFTEDLIENESNLMTQISEFSARKKLSVLECLVNTKN